MNYSKLNRGTDLGLLCVQVEIKTPTLLPSSRLMSLLLRGQPLHPTDTSEAVTSHEQPNSCRHPWEYGRSSTAAARWSGD
jgi:hypothetical protein